MSPQILATVPTDATTTAPAPATTARSRSGAPALAGEAA